MSTNTECDVLKFGSSVLRDENDLPRAVTEIYRRWRRGRKVLAVVSAFGNTTESLLQKARSVCSVPHSSSLASLLATGESTAASLLGIALDHTGIPVTVLDPVLAGFRTKGESLNSELFHVDVGRLNADLSMGVVVIPGFVGRDEEGVTTLLGRGGSDFTALFLADRLGADCTLYKDVDGLYDKDPTEEGPRPNRYSRATWEHAERIGGSLVQAKAIRFAARRKLSFQITAPGVTASTVVGPGPSQLAQSENVPHSPLGVALLGYGSVGRGVLHRLQLWPDLFQVVGVAVRNRSKAIEAGLPDSLICTDPHALIERPCDVVVELIGGVTPARELIERSLELARHVVTANKALLSNEVEDLESLARRKGKQLLYSASVGGALPAIETLLRLRDQTRIRKISGVLNGTTNFILDRLADGEDIETAIRSAREKGYAEADPSLDLDGTDAAQKLVLLARAGFGTDISFDSISRVGIESLSSDDIQSARTEGKNIRLVATCRLDGEAISASVAPCALERSHPLAAVKGVENVLLIETANGETLRLSGKGAGRDPSAEAVIADLFDVPHNNLRSPTGIKTEEAEENVA